VTNDPSGVIIVLTKQYLKNNINGSEYYAGLG
jgi:hypothetical protein